MEDQKIRLDFMLYDKGLVTSRERGKEYINQGIVYVDGKVEKKCGKKISSSATIDIRGNTIPYVSRGGLKLDKAIKTFNIDLKDKICMDIGASTGGFTHCMLKFGARKVFAIDVGTDQLVKELKEDKRVVSMENTNIKYVTENQIGELCDFISIDVSFISLTKVIPNALNLLKKDGEIVALIKPQFEAGIGKVSKKGVVKNKKLHEEIIINIITFLTEQGLFVMNIDYSPIKGPNGNIEYLIQFRKEPKGIDKYFDIREVSNIVCLSHRHLNTEGI